MVDHETFGFVNLVRSKVCPVALEGGYSSDLPELIDAFLTGWQS